MLTLVLSLILLSIPAIGCTQTLRAQWSSKLLGVTVVPTCPTPDVVEQIRQTGVELGADYTEFPEVSAASLCPSTEHGAVFAWSNLTIVDPAVAQAEGTWEVAAGVTVGLHYKVRR